LFPARNRIVNVNVEPKPTWLVPQILLPWSSTNFRYHRVTVNTLTIPAL
jgi:hypothetical protein